MVTTFLSEDGEDGGADDDDDRSDREECACTRPSDFPVVEHAPCTHDEERALSQRIPHIQTKVLGGIDGAKVTAEEKNTSGEARFEAHREVERQPFLIGDKMEEVVEERAGERENKHPRSEREDEVLTLRNAFHAGWNHHRTIRDTHKDSKEKPPDDVGRWRSRG